MNEAISEVLAKLGVDSLEKLAFMFPFPESPPPDLELENSLGSSVNFTGPYSGTLTMILSDDVLRELTVNMLGVDEDEEVTPEQLNDAIGEAVNIICGNVLPLIAGKEAIFNIQAPEIFPGREPDEKSLTARAYLSIDEGWCDISLAFQGAAPETAAEAVEE
ncbi:MAG: chemotaxis protein CheX [Desulfobacterales bacterium]|nr:chemotaxis protein CheX [Desulfobacterales bacterium]